jgi:hypothetical protein
MMGKHRASNDKTNTKSLSPMYPNKLINPKMPMRTNVMQNNSIIEKIELTQRNIDINQDKFTNINIIVNNNYIKSIHHNRPEITNHKKHQSFSNSLIKKIITDSNNSQMLAIKGIKNNQNLFRNEKPKSSNILINKKPTYPETRPIYSMKNSTDIKEIFKELNRSKTDKKDPLLTTTQKIPHPINSNKIVYKNVLDKHNPFKNSPAVSTFIKSSYSKLSNKLKNNRAYTERSCSAVQGNNYNTSLRKNTNLVRSHDMSSNLEKSSNNLNTSVNIGLSQTKNGKVLNNKTNLVIVSLTKLPNNYKKQTTFQNIKNSKPMPTLISYANTPMHGRQKSMFQQSTSKNKINDFDSKHEVYGPEELHYYYVILNHKQKCFFDNDE